MADAKDFQFAIVGEDESAAAFNSVEARAERARKKLGAGAEKTRSAFQKAVGPALQLAPGLERALRPLERLQRTKQAFGEAFGRESSLVAKSSAMTIRSVASASAAGGQMRAEFVKAATGGRVLGGSLAQTAVAAQGARAAITLTGEGAGAAAGEMAGAGAAAEGAAAGVAGVGEAAVGAEAGLAGAAAAAGGLVAGLAAIVVAIPAAYAASQILAAKFAAPFARAGSEIQRTSELIGVNAGALQRWRGAAERAGIDAGAATSGLANLGQGLHDLQYGQGDATKAQLLTRMGVRIPRPGEKVDQDAVMRQIADKLAAMKDPYTRAHAARILGVEQMLPMLSKGSGAIAADMAGYDKTNAAQTPSQLAKSEAARRRQVNFDQSLYGAQKNVAAQAMDYSSPGLEMGAAGLQKFSGSTDAAREALDKFTGVLGGKGLPTRAPAQVTPGMPAHLRRRNEHEAENMRRRRAGASPNPKPPNPKPQIGRPAPPVSPAEPRDVSQREGQAIAYLERAGYSHEAAVGFVAGLKGENDTLDPHRRQMSAKGRPGPGFGIAQWEPARQAEFKAFIGKDIHESKFEEQLRFIVHELQTTEKPKGDRLRAATTASEGASINVAYERPADIARALTRRRAIAEAMIDTPPQAAAVAGQGGKVDINLHITQGQAPKVVAKASGPAVGALRVERAMTTPSL